MSKNSDQENDKKSDSKKDTPSKKASKINNGFNAYVKYSQLALTIVTSLVLGVVIGRYLDGVFNTDPWLLLIFTFAGIGAAFRYLFSLFDGK